MGAVEKGMYANGFQSPTGQDSTVDTKDFQVMVSSLIISIFFRRCGFSFLINKCTVLKAVKIALLTLK